jgi:choline dehydrogenase-like flavoprotein
MIWPVIHDEDHQVPEVRVTVAFLTLRFVVGRGIFPTFNGYNPTETIQATTYRTADHIKSETRHGGVLTRG